MNFEDKKVFVGNLPLFTKEDEVVDILRGFTTNLSITEIFVWKNRNTPNESADNDYITFNQTIVVVYGDDSNNNNKDSNLIEREEKDYYHFMCRRNRTIVGKLFGGGYFNTTFRQEGRREDSK